MKRRLNLWGYFGITLLIVVTLSHSVLSIWGFLGLIGWAVSVDLILASILIISTGILIYSIAKMEFIDRYPVKLTRFYIYRAEVYDKESGEYVERFSVVLEHETARQFYTKYYSFKTSKGEPEFTHFDRPSGYETKEEAMAWIDSYIRDLLASDKQEEKQLVRNIESVEVIDVDLRKKKLANEAENR